MIIAAIAFVVSAITVLALRAYHHMPAVIRAILSWRPITIPPALFGIYVVLLLVAWLIIKRRRQPDVSIDSAPSPSTAPGIVEEEIAGAIGESYSARAPRQGTATLSESVQDPYTDTVTLAHADSQPINLDWHEDSERLHAIADFSDRLKSLNVEATANESKAAHEVYSLQRAGLDRVLEYIDEPTLLTAALRDALLRLDQATKRNHDYDQRLRQDKGTQEILAQEYKTASNTLKAAVSRYRTLMQSYRLVGVTGNTRQYGCNVPGCSTGAYGDHDIQDHAIRVHHVTNV